MEAEFGYGFKLSDGEWKLNPYGSVSLVEEYTNEVRFGNRFSIGRDISFEIEGTESVGTRGSVSRSIRLTGDISW